MKQALHHLAAGEIAVVGVAIVAVCECAMNASVGWHYGHGGGVLWASIAAALAVGVEIVKWRVALLAGQAWQRNESAKFLAALGAIVATLSISMPAHLAFFALARSDIAAERQVESAVAAAATSTIEQDRASLALMKASPRYSSSAGCTNATVDASIKLCDEIARLEARLAASVETVAEAPAVGLADPQVAMLKWWWQSADERDIQIALAIVTTLAVEWISAFGFFVAGRHQGETGAERHGGSVGHGAPVPQPHAFSIDVTGSGVTAHPTFPGMEQLMRWKRERLEAADGQSLARDVAYLDYLSWVGQQAHEETLSVVIFHRLLARTIPALGAAYPGWRLREARRQVVSA